MEDRFYRPTDPARIAAALTHDLPVAFITEARWIAEQLRARRPRAARVSTCATASTRTSSHRCRRRRSARRASRCAILVEGSPAVAFKGVGEALAATGAMHEPRTRDARLRRSRGRDAARAPTASSGR